MHERQISEQRKLFMATTTLGKVTLRLKTAVWEGQSCSPRQTSASSPGQRPPPAAAPAAGLAPEQRFHASPPPLPAQTNRDSPAPGGTFRWCHRLQRHLESEIPNSGRRGRAKRKEPRPAKSTAACGSGLQSTSSARAAPATAPCPGRTHLTGLAGAPPAAVAEPNAAAAPEGARDCGAPSAGSGTAGRANRHFRLAPPASGPGRHVAPAGLPGNAAYTRRCGRRPWRRGSGCRVGGGGWRVSGASRVRAGGGRVPEPLPVTLGASLPPSLLGALPGPGCSQTHVQGPSQTARYHGSNLRARGRPWDA